MKKLLFAALVPLVCPGLSAQRLPESKVPIVVKERFLKEYPGSKGRWDSEDGNFEVSFKKEGKAMSLVIQKDGTILETETAIPVTDLNPAIVAYMKEHYKAEKIKEAAKIVRGNGEVNYEAEINHKDILFDANGKFLKEVGD